MLHLLMIAFFCCWAFNIADSWNAPKTAPFRPLPTAAEMAESRRRTEREGAILFYAFITVPWLLLIYLCS